MLAGSETGALTRSAPACSSLASSAAGSFLSTEFTSYALSPQAWELHCQQLLEFRARFGHTHVPDDWRTNPQLSAWMREVRRLYRARQLSRERVLHALTIGFALHLDPPVDQPPAYEVTALSKRRIQRFWNVQMYTQNSVASASAPPQQQQSQPLLPNTTAPAAASSSASTLGRAVLNPKPLTSPSHRSVSANGHRSHVVSAPPSPLSRPHPAAIARDQALLHMNSSGFGRHKKSKLSSSSHANFYRRISTNATPEPFDPIGEILSSHVSLPPPVIPHSPPSPVLPPPLPPSLNEFPFATTSALPTLTPPTVRRSSAGTFVFEIGGFGSGRLIANTLQKTNRLRSNLQQQQQQQQQQQNSTVTTACNTDDLKENRPPNLAPLVVTSFATSTGASGHNITALPPPLADPPVRSTPAIASVDASRFAAQYMALIDYRKAHENSTPSAQHPLGQWLLSVKEQLSREQAGLLERIDVDWEQLHKTQRAQHKPSPAPAELSSEEPSGVANNSSDSAADAFDSMSGSAVAALNSTADANTSLMTSEFSMSMPAAWAQSGALH